VQQQHSSGQTGGLPSGEEVNIEVLMGPTKSSHRHSKTFASMSKEARKALKAAREEHIKEQTEKLGDEQARALEAKMRVQAQHLKDLRGRHAVEGKMLQATFAKEVEEFEQKMLKIRTSVEQYNEMEK
jgi:hypothetical protein